MKATIELPDLPDGWEVVGCFRSYTAKQGDKWFDGSFWNDCKTGTTYCNVIAARRRRQTLADWANEQPDLQAYARLYKCGCGRKINNQHGWYDCNSAFYMPSWPTCKIIGEIYVQDGKWVNA
jgi:hypothetical protein